MRILLVEAENNVAAYLRKGLMENGFAVDVARQPDDARDCVNRTAYDLLVCDVMTKSAGLKAFKGGGQQTPVLFLTSRDTARTGTGNYLAKPFGFSDLLTRVRSILHWGPGSVQECLQIADLRMDLVRHRAWRGETRLDLTPKEFLLLSLLMRKSGDILSRALIADQVWDINFETNTNFVDVHIRRLRAKVDDPFPKKLIHTARGAGYVLEDRGRRNPDDESVMSR
jgi:two-component system, OmpR family, copper resistance phosphate regulon response regulator CusR